MDRRRPALAAVVLGAAVLLAGCSAADPAPGPASTAATSGSTSATPSSSAASPSGGSSAGATPSTSTQASVSRPPRVARVTSLATGLVVPWGLAFLPDGSALVGERRSGEVVRVRPDGTTTPVGRVPGVADRGEGGLLGLAVAPGATTLLAYLTTEQDNRVVALPFDGSRLGAPRALLTGIPAGRIHNGGRIVVGPDGRLWIGTGDGGETSRAQSAGSLGGKILRIATDGSIPADNPDPRSPVWSRGHRNVQGLAFDSAGRLWATEFGQNRWDELNLIRKGADYGWPLVEGRGGGDRFVDPQVVWPTDEASPSGLAIVDEVAVIGALRGERLWLVPLADGRAGEPGAALVGRYGRLRTAVLAPDGSVWVTTSNRDGRGDPRAGDDHVLRVELTRG